MEKERDYKGFLSAVSEALKERALEAVEKKKDEYDSGRVMGFNESISIIQQTAQGMGIDLAEIGLDDINPDNDLV